MSSALNMFMAFSDCFNAPGECTIEGARGDAKRAFEASKAAAIRTFYESYKRSRADYEAVLSDIEAPKTLAEVIDFWLKDNAVHLISVCATVLDSIEATRAWWDDVEGGRHVSSHERYERMVEAEGRILKHPLDTRIVLPATWAAELHDAAVDSGFIPRDVVKRRTASLKRTSTMRDPYCGASILKGFEYCTTTEDVKEHHGEGAEIAPGVSSTFAEFLQKSMELVDQS
jgi:hypothetical protein